jgi:hypothetical protein
MIIKIFQLNQNKYFRPCINLEKDILLSFVIL